MVYEVGMHIDLSHLNASPGRVDSPVKKQVDRSFSYMTGTKISFLKMPLGMTIMNIVEPPIALRVGVGA